MLNNGFMKKRKSIKSFFRSKDVDLTSSEWCDLIFEDRNKSYGAYDMRKTSGRRHLLAFIILVLFFASVIFGPILMKTIASRLIMDKMLGITELSNIQFEEDKDKQIVPPEQTPPPMTPTVTPQKVPDENPAVLLNPEVPTIVADKDFKEEEAFRPVDDLKEKPDTIIKDTIDLFDLMSERYTVEDLYTNVDEMPGFPGGEQGLAEFISQNIKYPTAAFNRGIQGSLICTFIVEKDGSVSHPEIKQAANANLNKEALRVISTLPKWQPGKKHGKPVRVKYTLPLIFNLQ
jgi:periplasmic protein TonB